MNQSPLSTMSTIEPLIRSPLRDTTNQIINSGGGSLSKSPETLSAKGNRTFTLTPEPDDTKPSSIHSTPSKVPDCDVESDTTGDYESAGETSPWKERPPTPSSLSRLAEELASVHLSTPRHPTNASSPNLLHHFPFSPISAEDETDSEIASITSKTSPNSVSLSLMKNNSTLRSEETLTNNVFIRYPDNEKKLSTDFKFSENTVDPNHPVDTNLLTVQNNPHNNGNNPSPMSDFEDAGPTCSFHSELMNSVSSLNGSIINHSLVGECRHDSCKVEDGSFRKLPGKESTPPKNHVNSKDVNSISILEEEKEINKSVSLKDIILTPQNKIHDLSKVSKEVLVPPNSDHVIENSIYEPVKFIEDSGKNLVQENGLFTDVLKDKQLDIKANPENVIVKPNLSDYRSDINTTRPINNIASVNNLVQGNNRTIELVEEAKPVDVNIHSQNEASQPNLSDSQSVINTATPMNSITSVNNLVQENNPTFELVEEAKPVDVNIHTQNEASQPNLADFQSGINTATPMNNITSDNNLVLGNNPTFELLKEAKQVDVNIHPLNEASQPNLSDSQSGINTATPMNNITSDINSVQENNPTFESVVEANKQSDVRILPQNEASQPNLSDSQSGINTATPMNNITSDINSVQENNPTFESVVEANKQSDVRILPQNEASQPNLSDSQSVINSEQPMNNITSDINFVQGNNPTFESVVEANKQSDVMILPQNEASQPNLSDSQSVINSEQPMNNITSDINSVQGNNPTFESVVEANKQSDVMILPQNEASQTNLSDSQSVINSATPMDKITSDNNPVQGNNPTFELVEEDKQSDVKIRPQNETSKSNLSNSQSVIISATPMNNITSDNNLAQGNNPTFELVEEDKQSDVKILPQNEASQSNSQSVINTTTPSKYNNASVNNLVQENNTTFEMVEEAKHSDVEIHPQKETSQPNVLYSKSEGPSNVRETETPCVESDVKDLDKIVETEKSTAEVTSVMEVEEGVRNKSLSMDVSIDLSQIQNSSFDSHCLPSQSTHNITNNVMRLATEKHPACIEESPENIRALVSPLKIHTSNNITGNEMETEVILESQLPIDNGNISIKEMCTLIENTFNSEPHEKAENNVEVDLICQTSLSEGVSPLLINAIEEKNVDLCIEPMSNGVNHMMPESAKLNKSTHKDVVIPDETQEMPSECLNQQKDYMEKLAPTLTELVPNSQFLSDAVNKMSYDCSRMNVPTVIGSTNNFFSLTSEIKPTNLVVQGKTIADAKDLCSETPLNKEIKTDTTVIMKTDLNEQISPSSISDVSPPTDKKPQNDSVSFVLSVDNVTKPLKSPRKTKLDLEYPPISNIVLPASKSGKSVVLNSSEVSVSKSSAENRLGDNIRLAKDVEAFTDNSIKQSVSTLSSCIEQGEVKTSVSPIVSCPLSTVLSPVLDRNSAEFTKKSYENLLEKCSEQERLLSFDVSIKEEAGKVVNEIRSFSEYGPSGEVFTSPTPSSAVSESKSQGDVNEDNFQEGLNFDFDYLSKCAGRREKGFRPRDSLFLKFDPLASVASPSSASHPQPPAASPMGARLTTTERGEESSDDGERVFSSPSRSDVRLTEELGPLIPVTPCSSSRSVKHEAPPASEAAALPPQATPFSPPLSQNQDLALEKLAAELVSAKEEIKKIENLKLQLTAKDEEIKNLETEKAGLLRITDEAIQMAEEKGAEIMKLKREKAEVHAKCMKLEDQIAYLQEELSTSQTHLRNSEISFNDIHKKYEKSKVAIEQFMLNQKEYERCLEVNKNTISELEGKLKKIKDVATEKLKEANTEITEMKKAHELEMARSAAGIRKLELENKCLQANLHTKTKEIAELTQICDELTKLR